MEDVANVAQIVFENVPQPRRGRRGHELVDRRDVSAAKLIEYGTVSAAPRTRHLDRAHEGVRHAGHCRHDDRLPRLVATSNDIRDATKAARVRQAASAELVDDHRETGVRGIGASRIAALYAKVAKITAACFTSSGFMRSIVSMFV